MADAIPLALGSALRRGRSQLVQTRGDDYPSGLRLEVNDSALVLGKETTVASLSQTLGRPSLNSSSSYSSRFSLSSLQE